MWLGVVMFCMNADAASCDVMISTKELYLSEEQCWNDVETISRDMVESVGAYRSNYACMKIDALGSPV